MENEIIKIKSDIEDVLDAFALVRNTKCALLDHWLGASFELSSRDWETLEEKRLLLVEEGDFWNEEELKMHFLAFLFDVAKLDEKGKIKLFFERPMAAVINHYEINVVCDAMLATPKGIGKPKHPYFFLQEFAEGQMLLAMLVSQVENADNQPVYGCWLQGRNWIFTTLHETNYCISKQFDVSKVEDLTAVVYALKHLKEIILKQIEMTKKT